MKNTLLKVFILVLMILISLFVLSGCQKNELEGLEIYKDSKEKDYSHYSGIIDVKLSYPSNWVIGNDDEKQPIYVATDGSRAMFSLESYKTELSIEELEDKIKDDLKNDVTTIGDVPSKFINLNGRKACLVEYVIEVDEATEFSEKGEVLSTTPTKFKFTQVAFKEKDQVYSLTISAPEEGYKKVEYKINTIIKSFSK